MDTKRGMLCVLMAAVMLMMACTLGNVGENPEAQQATAVAGTVAAKLTQSAGEAQPEETATQQATGSITDTPTSTPTGTPTTPPTSPPAATATNTATSVPCNKAQFVSDVTYPDDSEVTKNTAFVKTWRFKEYRLLHLDLWLPALIQPR